MKKSSVRFFFFFLCNRNLNPKRNSTLCQRAFFHSLVVATNSLFSLSPSLSLSFCKHLFASLMIFGCFNLDRSSLHTFFFFFLIIISSPPPCFGLVLNSSFDLLLSPCSNVLRIIIVLRSIVVREIYFLWQRSRNSFFFFFFFRVPNDRSVSFVRPSDLFLFLSTLLSIRCVISISLVLPPPLFFVNLLPFVLNYLATSSPPNFFVCCSFYTYLSNVI